MQNSRRCVRLIGKELFYGSAFRIVFKIFHFDVQFFNLARVEYMDNSEILRVLMPQRTKQIALAWSILGDSCFAEDAYQDMLAKVLENSDIFEGPAHLRDWSWRVLRNGCYSVVRRQKCRMKLLDDSVLELIDSELEHRDLGNSHDQSDALRTCLGSLTTRANDIVRLRYFEGLRASEVADRLGQKPDAVYKALQRIYATLAECISGKLADAEVRGPRP